MSIRALRLSIRALRWASRRLLAGSVVYDDAANRFWFAWLQRGTGFGQSHDVFAGYLPGDLDASAGHLGVTREIVDHVAWSGLNGIDVWANGQIAFDDRGCWLCEGRQGHLRVQAVRG